MQEDTISAIATAIGEGGVGIVRLSGSDSLLIAERIFRSASCKELRKVANGKVCYGHIVDPDTGSVIDEALLLVMRAPHSYTREHVVELQCHGGPLVMRSILSLTLKAGARLAEPGEFTKRAFLNGRLDLSQAEAVIDVIRSKTDAALKAAVANLTGSLATKVFDLREIILGIIAQLEAHIDFPEEDLSELRPDNVYAALQKAIDGLDSLLATVATGRIVSEGLQTVIIGKPNVGKSSLLNALLREKRAIVSDVPGTTRDSIEEFVNIRGIPLKIIDTAGIRETTDIVEKFGVERTRDLVERADLVLVLLDASQPLSAEDQQVIDLLPGRQAVILVNKSDLPERLSREALATQAGERSIIAISVLEGTGLDLLEQYIVDMVYSGGVTVGEGALVTNVRHSELLRQARVCLEDVRVAINVGMPHDCQVIDLRQAWEKLGEVSGETVGEDIINQIFSRFCIGK